VGQIQEKSGKKNQKPGQIREKKPKAGTRPGQVWDTKIQIPDKFNKNKLKTRTNPSNKN